MHGKNRKSQKCSRLKHDCEVRSNKSRFFKHNLKRATSVWTRRRWMHRDESVRPKHRLHSLKQNLLKQKLITARLIMMRSDTRLSRKMATCRSELDDRREQPLRHTQPQFALLSDKWTW